MLGGEGQPDNCCQLSFQHARQLAFLAVPAQPWSCPALRVPPGQVAELCEAANKEVAADQRVQIANYLCNGNYAVSGGIAGCEAVEKLAKSFKARWAL